jgi:hypothetical protein
MKSISFILFLLLTVQFSFTQETEYLKTHQGQTHYTYKPVPFDALDFTLTKTEEIAVKNSLDAIAKFVEGSEGFKNPNGVEIFIKSKLSEKSPWVKWLNSIPGEIYVDFYPWYMANGVETHECHECSRYFTIYVNRPEYAFIGQTLPMGFDLYDEDGAVIGIEPVKIAEQNGAVFYNNGRAVVSKPGIPVWLPVTVRQYDNLLLHRIEELMKEKPDEKMAYEFFQNKLKDEMAVFSEKELDMPAHVYAVGASPASADATLPIVKLNKAYFDQSLSRSKPQVLIFDFGSGLTDNPENPYYEDSYSTFQQITMNQTMKLFNFDGLRGFIK